MMWTVATISPSHEHAFEAFFNMYDGRAAPRRVNGKTGGAKSPQDREARRWAEQGTAGGGAEHRGGRVGEGGGR